MKGKRTRILEIIKERKNVRIPDLVRELKISRQGVFKHLKNLLESGSIRKVGKPPKVYYQVAPEKSVRRTVSLDKSIEDYIENEYMVISPGGEFLEGMEGFEYWCKRVNLPVEKTAKEYVRTSKRYLRIKQDNLICGLEKLSSTFEEVFLDELYYASFYSIERFGKTKLGQFLLYAKQSQNRELIEKISIIVKPVIKEIIASHQIDTIVFVPPTVKREIQFMKELEYYLDIKLPRIEIDKIRTDIIVPQKTLSRIEDRIENAERTFIVGSQSLGARNILIIDDAVGSGSTLNIIAKKLREKGHSGKIVGFAVTGSVKGFDVISEV